MRTLDEILEHAKTGERPSLEECYWAMLALEQLWAWNARAYGQAVHGDKPRGFVLAKSESDFQMGKTALAKDPKAWLGPSHDWSLPENRRRRRASLGLLDRAMAGTLPNQKDKTP